MSTIDLNTFDEDDQFFDTFNLVCTIKSFDLQAIRKRYIASKKNSKTGSVERRAVATGGIVDLSLSNGKITNSEVLIQMKEPRGIAGNENTFGIAAENELFILHNGAKYNIDYPWFSYIHTLDFHPYKENIVLVSSSGLDCIFEFDFLKNEKVYEWFAWENGFNTAFDKDQNQIKLTRNEEKAAEYARNGIAYKLISNPKEDVLPTAQRAAFINSVTYDQKRENHLLATFFHEGKVFSIDQETGQSKPIIDGLKNPHGGRNFGQRYMATSTGDGFVKIDNQEIYDFRNLDHKPPEMAGLEWLQNSIPVGPDTFITIDSNRNQFVICNTKAKKISRIDYDNNWAIQDFVNKKLTSEEINFIKNLRPL